MPSESNNNVGVPATCKGKWVRVEMEDGRGMVMEDECVVCIRNLSERLLLILKRACTLVCVVVVVVVVVFSRKRSLSVTKVEFLGEGGGVLGW